MAEDFTLRATCECYYKFENAGDLGEDSQGQIALTNTNGVTQSSDIPSGTYAAPTAQNSADFESGSTQYLEASHAVSQEIDDLTAITVVMWIKPESTSAHMALWSKTNDGADGHRGTWLTSSGGTLYFGFGGTDTTQILALSAGIWFFLAFTYSQTSDAKRLYKGTESVQVAQLGTDSSSVDKTASTTAPFAVGATEVAHGIPFDGLMCEFAIFSEALSLAELQEIQADGMEGSPAAGIVAQMLQHHGG